MSDINVVRNMISYIEEKELQLQADRFASVTQSKNDIIKNILDKLEEEIENEANSD